MPKLGRRNEKHQFEYMFDAKQVTQNAPFGTQETPAQRFRIIGGKPVMVQEDHVITNSKDAFFQSPYATARVTPEPQGIRHGSMTPQKLAPLTEKPNQFNPATFVSKNKNFYASAHQDAYNSHLHSPDPTRPINPHHVVPPIGQSGDTRLEMQNSQTEPSANGDVYDRMQAALKRDSPRRTEPHYGGIDLLKYLPLKENLPREPITLTKREELELSRRIHQDLTLFDAKKLKDIYLELAGFDTNLTGFVTYSDLSFSLMRMQATLSMLNLRLVAAMCVSAETGKVNYEKVLSFIAAAIKGPEGTPRQPARQPATKPVVQQPQQYDRSTQSTPGLEEEMLLVSPHAKLPSSYNPITHEVEDYSKKRETPSPRTKRFPYGAGDNAKLLRLIEQALLESDEELNFDRIYHSFQQADRQHRGMLSREQIKKIAKDCQIPLTESIMDNIINKCDSSNGQYAWSQVIEFIERVEPVMTGLNIPESKKPKDYARPVASPSYDWPNVSANNSKQGTSVPVTPQPSQPARAAHVQARPDDRSRHEQLQNMKEAEQAQAHTHRLEAEMIELEQQYKESKRQLLTKAKHLDSQDVEPWFERYMNLAKALYQNDDTSTGFLHVDEVRWLAKEYNRNYKLGIPEDDLQKAISMTKQGSKVAIDPFLKALAVHES